MHTVGLTGGIASGKSTVAEILRRRGVPVIDADQVSREIVEPGQPALAEIAAAFGAEMLQSDGTLNRRALGARVMGDGERAQRERKALERITHPRIFGRIGEKLQALRESLATLAVELLLCNECKPKIARGLPAWSVEVTAQSQIPLVRSRRDAWLAAATIPAPGKARASVT